MCKLEANLLSDLLHYRGITVASFPTTTVTFIPVTVTTAVKYLALSPLKRITVVPITVQLSSLNLQASQCEVCVVVC